MSRFAMPLLRWYKKAGRDLPWRKTTVGGVPPDPYAIWVSEILLQQTQVSTVLPYYHRFLSNFPTVQSLAAAEIDDVLKCWQGLGYYARARNLLLAARRIVDRFGGTVPLTLSELLTLPGIGRSSAGAILNIAFSQRHPILDGNVKRILVRVFCIAKDPKERQVTEKLWRLSESLLPKTRADHFTQAIMDLGATICTPAAPKCDCCPVSRLCKGYQKGLQNKLPIRPVRKKTPHYDYVCAIIRNGEKVLIKKRQETGLLGGLWEFPGGRVSNLCSDASPSRGSKVGMGFIGKSLNEIIEKEVGQSVALTPLGLEIKHAFTHFKMTIHLFAGSVRKSKTQLPLKWVPIDQLKEHPFSSAHQKIILKLQNVRQSRRDLWCG
ncbi:MAG: A/G-specific adenine glycosylase [Nitrospirae bacterium]|nr:A/G-specific adenine glycosylase [Candidatus Troglogloeales bacterium]